MECPACGRQVQDRYCKYHEQAFSSLKAHHEAWVRAYGSITWQEFLERLHEMKETGQWVREVIKVELKK
ncbi:MAG: hypothetical protein QXJ74_04020 [Nitrososphaera sp.]|uniref:hypothetical protein n=1 Tax=Nitrososphaera sp. TaxID=1971748 RepID=UPI00179D2F29|nr:hypothetical protein [Nitrososphaera sp.]NWG36089.1 hypothetical protein [Nitrososphaera sp.]